MTAFLSAQRAPRTVSAVLAAPLGAGSRMTVRKRSLRRHYADRGASTILTVENSSGTSLTSASFVGVGDAIQVVCYAAGMRILTATGESRLACGLASSPHPCRDALLFLTDSRQPGKRTGND
jgi:hypothetical protein